MINYQYLLDFYNQIATNCISKLENNIQVAVIPNDPENSDWQAYQVWLSEGNTPLSTETN